MYPAGELRTFVNKFTQQMLSGASRRAQAESGQPSNENVLISLLRAAVYGRCPSQLTSHMNWLVPCEKRPHPAARAPICPKPRRGRYSYVGMADQQRRAILRRHELASVVDIVRQRCQRILYRGNTVAFGVERRITWRQW